MEFPIPLELPVPVDWRLAVTVVMILVASYAKGVAGMGVPVIATPVIALLYDLRTAIPLVALSLVLSDIPFVLRGLPYLREGLRLIPFIATGMVGIFIGASLLVTLDERLLAGLLGVTVTIFVITSWFGVLPLLSPRVARIAGPPFGLIAGIVQGSSGASGPLATMYLLSIGVSRHVFMFVINAIFLLMDSTQFVALFRVGLYTPTMLTAAVLACLPMAVGVFLGIKSHKYVNDLIFRRVILVILVFAAINLFAKAASSL